MLLLLFIAFPTLFLSNIHKDGKYHPDRSCSRHGLRTPCFVTWLSLNVWSFGMAIDLAKGGLVHDMLTCIQSSVQATSWRIASPMKQLFESWWIPVGFGSPQTLAACSEALTQIVQKNLQSLNAADSHLHMEKANQNSDIAFSRTSLYFSIFSLVFIFVFGCWDLSLAHLPRGQRADCSLWRYGPLAHTEKKVKKHDKSEKSGWSRLIPSIQFHDQWLDIVRTVHYCPTLVGCFA